MAKNQTTAKEKAAAPSSARAAKPRAPRVTTAQHSKTVSSEPVETPVMRHSAESAHQESAHQEISEIAYSYWEARGYHHGAHLEDWVRAENEYRKRLAATIL